MRNFLQQRWQSFLARRHPQAHNTLTLVHKRIYIVPTKRGWGFALLVALVLIGAINYQMSLGFFFTFLLAGIAHAAMLRTYAALLGLEIRAGNTDPVFAGETARFLLILTDRRGRSRSGIVTQTPSGTSSSVDVAANAETLTHLNIQAVQRGRLTLPRSRMECRTPTGWFVAWTYVLLACDCLVYPRPEQQPPPLPTGAQSGSGGLLAGQGDDDFAGLREYHPGDSPRRVAWKQVARSDQMFTKSFQSPLSSEVILDWHTLSGLDTEARLSRLTAWVLQAEAGGHRYALILPNFVQPLGHGMTQRMECLAALALFPAEGAS